MEIRKAVREKVKMKVVLMGVSGSGKSKSALRLATGMGGKILLINTEKGRGLYYASEFDYDILDIEAPFTPEKYIKALQAGVNGGYNVIIIDSGSHEWMGKGGILYDKASMPGANDFVKWAKLTPRHDDFVDAIVSADVHTIVCLRCKDGYITEENERGKQAPRKVGLGAQQRDGMEYESTVVFMIDSDRHIATPTKDNTGIWDGTYCLLTEKDGEDMIKWANNGVVAKRKEPEAKDDQTRSKELKSVFESVGITSTKEMLSELEAMKNAGIVDNTKASTWSEAEFMAVIAAILEKNSTLDYNSNVAEVAPIEN